jgi:hypothetical protein
VYATSPLLHPSAGEVAYATSLPPFPRERWRTPLSRQFLAERRGLCTPFPGLLAEEAA